RLSPPRRHPGRPPRIRAVTFPLLPPRVPHCPVGGVGLRRRGPAHPGSAASYAVRVPRCRGLSPASCRLRLATPPLPSTRSYPRLPSRGLSPPSNCPCRAYPLPRPCRVHPRRRGGERMGDVPHPYWPLFDLRIRTPRLELRVPDDGDLIDLATLAALGVHADSFMPFNVPWTDEPSPKRERDLMQWQWRNRSECSPVCWRLAFAAVE